MSTTQPQYPVVTSEYAVVIAVHHPLVRARGFQSVSVGEVVIFEDNSLGQVLSFTDEAIDIMVFSTKPVAIESKISRTGHVLSFPVSRLKTGAIFSPHGEVVLGTAASSSSSEEYSSIFKVPPRISQRKRITKQLETGFSLTDILLPIGHGQRELLVGDRKAGKSDFARGVALTQAQSGTTVVYGLVGKKVADIKKTYDFFKKSGVLENIILVASTTQDPVSTITITPVAAMTVAEHLVSQGKDVLLILDDLTTHAEFYRELSLLAKRFPGRDSYPGDIFYRHAQLLERAGMFSHDKNTAGEVSLTCLPVVRTINSDLTDFITSNLISITDGHLLFDTKLFAQGFRPAIDTKLSVTRVGKQTQSPLQRDINQELTSFLTSYRKTKNLTHLGSEISTRSQEVLKKGDLITNFLSDSQQQGIATTVRLIILGLIWQGWYAQTHENALKSSIFQLSKQYQTSTIATQLDEYVTAPSFTAFLSKIKSNQTQLRQLCQI